MSVPTCNLDAEEGGRFLEHLSQSASPTAETDVQVKDPVLVKTRGPLRLGWISALPLGSWAKDISLRDGKTPSKI